MKTILVDDEIASEEVFQYEIANMPELEVVGMFLSGTEAITYVREHLVELAILDVRMEEMDGIRLGQELRKINPQIMLIYATGYEEYALDALRLHSAGYLLKPFSADDLRYAVESARLLSKRRGKRIFARTFGHFDLFVDGKPIMFKSSKAKELLALLIDRRGGTTTSDQIIGVLWENRPNDESTQNLCSKVAKTLQKELKANGVEELLESARGIRRVNTDVFDCDLYEMVDGEERSRKQYMGEYLIDYSWAESRMALLDKYLH